MSSVDHGFLSELRLHLSGQGDHRRLLDSFLDEVFFCEGPTHPGFLATPTAHGPLIPVFTSEATLAQMSGACRWFSTTGADLAALAPVGHRFVVDPGSPHQVVVDPKVLLEHVSGPAV